MAEESYMGSLDDIESVEAKSPRQQTQDYMDQCVHTMHVVGSILGEILAGQEEDRVVKWVKIVGKPFVAKSAIQNALITMRTSAFVYGDHHPEVDWYDYDEEIAEP